MNFCPNCGEKITGKFCANCGNGINSAATVATQAGSTEKKGLSIASMVLGIIAVVWGFIALVGMDRIEEALIEANIEDAAGYIGFLIGYNLLALICGIIGLCLGLKAPKNGKTKAGVITSIIALVSVAITVVYVICISA